jgi:precorrin-6B methylase 1
MKPGTNKTVSWDSVNAALSRMGVKTKHIADISMHVRPAEYKESIDESTKQQTRFDTSSIAYYASKLTANLIKE